MATADSGDRYLPKEAGSEVCVIIRSLIGDSMAPVIINCVAIKGASGNAFHRKEKFRAQVSRKLRSLKALKETVRFVYFLNLILRLTS